MNIRTSIADLWDRIKDAVFEAVAVRAAWFHWID